jgi:AcrR family transcriptional regulator
MPTPAKTSASEIVAAARDLIGERGLEALTMQAIAERVGVRGPSLYKHFADRAAVLLGVERSVAADLEAALTGAGRARDDGAALRAMANAYRRFARESPATYGLMFTLHSDDPEAEAARRQALRPALARLERYLGDAAAAFRRARALTAFLHGFVSMEAAGAFRMGGDIEAAFREGVELLLG